MISLLVQLCDYSFYRQAIVYYFIGLMYVHTIGVPGCCMCIILGYVHILCVQLNAITALVLKFAIVLAHTHLMA